MDDIKKLPTYPILPSTISGDGKNLMSPIKNTFTMHSQTINKLIDISLRATPQAPTLLNDWEDYGDVYGSASYMAGPNNMIYLSGYIKSGGVGTVIFRLPSGYRPPTRKVFLVVANGAFGQIDIDNNGDVIFISGSNVSVSLDGICFKAS